MIGQYVLPLLTPLWIKLRALSDTYGVTPLSYQITLTLTFLSAPAFMAVQMNKSGLAAFLLHFVVLAVQGKKGTSLADTLHVYGFCAVVVFATAFGVAGNYGMPVAFLFLSWMVLSYTNLIKPDALHLIGAFEVGLSVVALGFAAVYTPAIAILFGLACLVSSGITVVMDFRKKG